MQTLSCGIVLFNENRELFLAHVTGSPHWDIPKGAADPGESPLAAAIRETREETGLAFCQEELLDAGEHPYRADKRLHLFLAYRPRASLTLPECCCTSFFTHVSGKQLPEVDAFQWVPFEEVPKRCAKNMTKLLTVTLNLPTLFDQVFPLSECAPLTPLTVKNG